MKIAVISDSHGAVNNIRRGLNNLPEIDRLLFAGDGIKSLVSSNLTQEIKITVVKGNRDRLAAYPEEKVMMLNEKKFFLTHGNNYGVRWGLDKLYYRAQELEADVVVFGHTHCRYAAKEGGVLFFNPGSVALPRDQFPPSYGLIEIREGEINYEYYELT